MAATRSRLRAAPVVTAAEHNAVLEAAQRRVDKLEGRLAGVIEPILARAGRQAAARFHARATNHLLAAAANTDIATNSTMIALKPRPAEAAMIADPGGDPAEILHVTLVYVGETDQPLQEIADALKPVAATYGPLSGVVGGYGIFDPAGVGILLPDVRGLGEVRVAVTEALLDGGIDYSRAHGFLPHMTIHSDPETADGDEALARASEASLHFDAIHVVRGNEEEIVLPLVGVRALTAAGPPAWTPPFPDELIDVDALVKQILEKTDPVRKAIIEQTMTPALKQAGLAWDVTNPLTAGMLAQSAAQVTNIARTTRTNVLRIIGSAYQNGLTIPQTAGLIRTGMVEASKTRATMIARTELGRAANGGSLAATQLVAQATGDTYDKTWLTAPGAKYPRHEDYDGLDGQTVGLHDAFDVGGDQLQFPGDPNGEPGETINCLPGETVVQMGSLRAATRRWYEGDLVRVRLASGDELAATPNHPILRSDGSWVPIGEVEEGDHLVSATLVGHDVGAPDPDRPPSPISEIHRLAEMLADPERVRLAPPDFHGDGRDGEVDVVPIHGSLLIDSEAATDEQVREFGFALAGGARAGACSGEMATLGDWWGAELTAAIATAGIVRGLRESTALVTAKTGHPQLVRGGAGADGDAELLQAARDCWAADPNGLTDGKHAVSTVVSLAEVVQIDRYAFAGDVYNLDTGVGWYTAGSLVCGNCRCSLSYAEPPPGEAAPVEPPENQSLVEEALTGLKKLVSDETGAVELPKVKLPTGAADVVTADVETAARALSEGKTVQLTSTSQLNTFIDDLGKMAADAQKTGKSAPDLDLAKVSVKGTNLFAHDTLGIPRVDMPQLSGLPVPGSPASKLPTTIFEGKPSPWVDISQSFFQSLKDQGVRVTEEKVNPESLKATQNQLNGPKIAKLMDDLESGVDTGNENIVISSDNYILDGHHHWAAQIGVDYKSGVDVPHPMNVIRIDEPIATLLQQARDYAKEMGIPPQSAFNAAPVKTAVSAVEPPVAPSVPADFRQSVDIGITPFRADEDNAVGFYSSPKYQQFVKDVNESAQAYGVHVDGLDHVTGVWEGDTEPSVSLRVTQVEPEKTSDAYKGQHTAPGPDYGAPMDDLTGEHNGAQIYPKDVYDEKMQVRLYGMGGDAETRAMDQEAFNTVNGVKGDPTAMVTIYRAVPSDVTEIHPGDWVTPVKAYAEHHAEGNLGADVEGHVISMQVPAGQLWTDGNSIEEWGWNPPNRDAFDAEARFRAFASNLGQSYNQDGVLLFTPDATGKSIMATFRATIPQNRVTAAMRSVKISGARFTPDGRLQVIGPRTKEFADKLGELSKQLSAPEVTTPGQPFIVDPKDLFKKMPSYLRDVSDLAQLRVLLGGDEAAIADAFHVEADLVAFDDIGIAKEMLYDSTQESLKARGLPARFKVYAPKAPDFTRVEIPVEEFHLTPQPGDTVAFEVERKDVLLDSDAFVDPPIGAPSGRVLIRAGRSNLTATSMPEKAGAAEKVGKPTDGSYDVARGAFDMLERDNGDYRKALDAFAHPKDVTSAHVPRRRKTPSAKLARGEPITGFPRSGFGEDLLKSYDMQTNFLKDPALKGWVEHVNADEDLTLGVSPGPGGRELSTVIGEYTQNGSHDINAYLAGHKLDDYDLDQYNDVQDVEANAKAMKEIVDSAPPLPPGTTLYRGINPVGVNPALRDEGNAAAQEILGQLRAKWGLDKLDSGSVAYRKIFEDPEFKKEHRKAVKDSYNAITKIVGNWATEKYPVGSYVAMGEPGEFESMTLNPALAANFGPSAGQPSVVFQVVNAKTGAPIFPFSQFTDESEVLAPPDTFYRVRSVELRKMDIAGAPPEIGKTADKVVVNLEEVPRCGPGEGLTAAVGETCATVGQYVPKGDKPPTVGSGDLFPGQDQTVGAHAAQTRADAIARYAADNGMTTDEYKAATEQVIRSYVSAHPQIRVRVTHDVLAEILHTGRFKSEFELPGVTPDMVEGRVAAEKKLFGYAENTDPAKRPIYGYLAGTANESGSINEYGDMLVNLDPAVNARATFTIGDSFRAGIRNDLSPSLLGTPGIGSWDGSFDIVKAYREGNLEGITKYVEVEVHDGLLASEIGGITPDYALIREREYAERLKEAVDSVTELAANYEGTQLETQQTEQAGIPTEKPAQLDYASALRDMAKNATKRNDIIRALLSEAGLRLRDVKNFAAVDELLAKAAI